MYLVAQAIVSIIPGDLGTNEDIPKTAVYPIKISYEIAGDSRYILKYYTMIRYV
jgi:hypothetical protein